MQQSWQHNPITHCMEQYFTPSLQRVWA
jgi:hypothetical protein